LQRLHQRMAHVPKFPCRRDPAEYTGADCVTPLCRGSRTRWWAFCRVFHGAFRHRLFGTPRGVEAKSAVEAPWAMRFATGVLALACASVGVYPALLLRPLSLVANGLIPYGNAPPELSVLPKLLPILSLCVLGAVLIALAIPRVIRVTAIWACGLPQISPRMEYTATAFSKPLRSVFATVYK